VVQDQPLGTLVVSVPVTFGLARIVPLIAKLTRDHPGLQIDLRLDDRIVDLLSEGVDVAVRGGVDSPRIPDLVVHDLCVFERLLVATPDLVKQHPELRRSEDPEVLTRVPVLAQGPAGRASWSLTRTESKPADTHRIKVHGPISSNAPMVLRDACEAGLGVAMLPDWLVEDALKAKRLVQVLPTWRAAPSAMRAVYRVELRQLVSIRALVTALVAGLSTGTRKKRS
jgi:DNA-binding transcriptional LysR family regulator